MNGNSAQDTSERDETSKTRKSRISPKLACPVEDCPEGGHKYLKSALKRKHGKSPEEVTRLFKFARPTAHST
jgi:hypothetical protein